MKRRHATIQYTLRDVPATVDAALRRRAQTERRSLNDVAREAMARGAGVAGDHDDLDAFFGSWIEDAAVTRVLAAQRHVDEDLWR